MFTLIENGELYTPDYAGRASLLLAAGAIARVGNIDRSGLDRLNVEYDVVDASKQLIVPGLIDPHEHLDGASGSGGFVAETPPIFLSEIVAGGITTVVGTLGTDTTTKTMAGLLARVKGLNQAGLTAFCYTGGYSVPPPTVTGSVRNDVMLIAEIIGAGEICISDERSTDPSAHELGKIVSDAHVGGLLSGKAGVSHFHVGPRAKRMALLRTLIEEFDIEPEWLYPTHVGRNAELINEALELVKQGATVDIDVVEKDLPKWLGYYLDHEGDESRCTISSDAFATSPRNLFSQIRLCVLEDGLPMERVLPLATRNVARVLKLAMKGELAVGMDADVLLLEKSTLEIDSVFARGQCMVRDGRVVRSEGFLAESDRRIELAGRRQR
jgi:beta-aspartyl-dipeptidase (metallo-type)